MTKIVQKLHYQLFQLRQEMLLTSTWKRSRALE